MRASSPQRSPHSVVVCEYPSASGEPYYPVPSDANKELYHKYQELADAAEREEGVRFVGRLANYKYINMDQAVAFALRFAALANRRGGTRCDRSLDTACCHSALPVLCSAVAAGSASFLATLRFTCSIRCLCAQAAVAVLIHAHLSAFDKYVKAPRAEYTLSTDHDE